MRTFEASVCGVIQKIQYLMNWTGDAAVRRPHSEQVVDCGNDMTADQSAKFSQWVRLTPLAALAAWLAAAVPAAAADEEVQVYMDEIGQPGRLGLDIHTSYVFDGDPAPEVPGGQSPVHRWRMTPEWGFALTPNLELGAYLPLMTLEGSGRLQAAGAKGRVKFIAPRAADQSWWWGLNLEIGRVNHTLDLNPWNGELKGIWGMRKGRLTLALNANLGFVVSGPAPEPATLEIASKIAWRVSEGLDVGVESYNGLGPLAHLGPVSQEGHATYAVAEKSFGKWDLNLGVGHGYGANLDGWLVKAVIGVPIG
jgi:hypothetical protein